MKLGRTIAEGELVSPRNVGKAITGLLALGLALVLAVGAFAEEAVTTTAASADTASAGLFGNAMPLIMIVVLIAVFYFFMIRPEQKKRKAAEEMRSNLGVGDKITTIGGMVGKIVDISNDLITFETGEDRVRIQVTKWAISTNSIQKQEEKS